MTGADRKNRAIRAAAGLKPGITIVEGPFRVLKDLESGARVREIVEDDEPGDGAPGPDGARKKKKSRKKAP